MKYETEIVERVKQSQFICSSCGAGRDCDCNAPAMARLAEIKEQARQRDRAYKERKREEKQTTGDVASAEDDDELVEMFEGRRTGPDGLGSDEDGDYPNVQMPSPAINLICNSAYRVLKDAEALIDEEISLEDDAREALSNALHSCGDSLTRLAKTVSRREK